MAPERLQEVSGQNQVQEFPTTPENPTTPERPRFLIAHVPLSSINKLPQSRKTFTNIPEFADNIAQWGLINPLTVVRFSEKGCQDLLEAINEIHKTDYKAEDLTGVSESGEKHYYILACGERRLRALRHLLLVGCTSCHEEYGPGGCFERHFEDQGLDVSLCPNDIPPEVFFFIQASENTHERVPPHEEAEYLFNLYHSLKRKDPKFSQARLGRMVGRSPSTIRGRLRYCELPPEIQDLVIKDALPFGMGVEIARLQEAGISEQELSLWAIRAKVAQHKMPDFRKAISNRIYEFTHQRDMFEIFTEEQMREEMKHFIRETVKKKMVLGIWSLLYYFQEVNQYFLDGRLGKEDSPFSEGSPIRIFMELVDVQKDVLEHLKEFVSKDKYEEAKTILETTKQILDLIDEGRAKEPPKKETILFQAPALTRRV